MERGVGDQSYRIVVTTPDSSVTSVDGKKSSPVGTDVGRDAAGRSVQVQAGLSPRRSDSTSPEAKAGFPPKQGTFLDVPLQARAVKDRKAVDDRADDVQETPATASFLRLVMEQGNPFNVRLSAYAAHWAAGGSLETRPDVDELVGESGPIAQLAQAGAYPGGRTPEGGPAYRPWLQGALERDCLHERPQALQDMLEYLAGDAPIPPFAMLDVAQTLFESVLTASADTSEDVFAANFNAIENFLGQGVATTREDEPGGWRIHSMNRALVMLLHQRAQGGE